MPLLVAAFLLLDGQIQVFRRIVVNQFPDLQSVDNRLAGSVGVILVVGPGMSQDYAQSHLHEGLEVDSWPFE